MNIYWFRNNLRLKDNPSLEQAITESNQLALIYIIDESLFNQHELGFPLLGKYREKFWTESLLSLQNEITKRGGSLHILQGNPVAIFEKLSADLTIKTVYTSKEVGFYEQEQEKQISNFLKLEEIDDNSLYPTDALPFDLEKLPLVFTSYRKKVEKYAKVREEIPEIESLDTVSLDVDQYQLAIPDVEVHKNTAFTYQGGEKEAWQRVKDYFWESEKLAVYKETRNGMIGESYSSKLSPFLALGNISPVSIYHEIKRFEKEVISNQSTYWLIFELLWRDFFRMTSLKYGRQLFLFQGIGNHKPYIKPNEKIFQQWIDGETGDEFVDANMIELAETGFMSNRGRQNVASYLVHDLQQDWRWGAAYFESQLIDYDCASNWGNWMYLAGVGNDPRSRKFNTELQAERYDPDEKFRKLWLETKKTGSNF